MKSLLFLPLLALPGAYAHKPRLDDLLAPHHDYCRDFLRVKPSISTRYTTVTYIEKKTKYIHPLTVTKTRTVTIHHGKTTVRLPGTTVRKTETVRPEVTVVTSWEPTTVFVDSTRTVTSTKTTGGQQKKRRSISKEKRHFRVPDLRGYKSSEIKSCCERVLRKKPKWVKTVTKTVVRKSTTTKTIRKPARTNEIKKYITLPSKTVRLQSTKTSFSTITAAASRTETTVLTTPTTVERITTSTRIIEVPVIQIDYPNSFCGAGQSARSLSPQDPTKLTLVVAFQGNGYASYGQCLVQCRDHYPDCLAWRMSAQTTDCELFLVKREEGDPGTNCELETNMDRIPYKFDFVPAWLGDEAHQSGEFLCVGYEHTECERPEFVQKETPKPESVYCSAGEAANSFAFDSAENGHRLGQELIKSAEGGPLTQRQCAVYCQDRAPCAAWEWSWDHSTLTGGLLWGTCKVFLATDDENSTLQCPDLRDHAFSYSKSPTNSLCVGRGRCGPPKIYDKDVPFFSCSHGTPVTNFYPAFEWESKLAVTELLGKSTEECNAECESKPESCVAWRWDVYYGGACYIFGRMEEGETNCEALSGVIFNYSEDFTANERCIGRGACGPPKFEPEPR